MCICRPPGAVRRSLHFAGRRLTSQSAALCVTVCSVKDRGIGDKRLKADHRQHRPACHCMCMGQHPERYSLEVRFQLSGQPFAGMECYILPGEGGGFCPCKKTLACHSIIHHPCSIFQVSQRINVSQAFERSKPVLDDPPLLSFVENLTALPEYH